MAWKTKETALDARVVANKVLDLAEAEGVPMTNMGVLKVVFFAHGWFLSKYSVPLVRDNFEAWQHGPVVRSIYSEFKRFRAAPITSRATALDFATGQRCVAKAALPLAVEKFLQDVFAFYGRMDPLILSDMTHEDGTPWSAIRHSDRIEPGLLILDEDIKAYFDGKRFGRLSNLN